MSDQEAKRPEAPAPAPAPAPHVFPARRGGTTFGIVLVIIGLLMLFGRWVQWFDVFRLWPLLIVVGGVTQMVRPHGDVAIKRIAEGLGSVAVGLVLLGNSFGYIPWSVWITMLSLWPLLLVGLGIELLGRGLGLPWVRALSNVVLIAGLLYGVFVLQPGTLGLGVNVPGLTRAGVAYSDSAPHQPDVRDGSVEIKAGATRLTIGAGADLASISGHAPTDAAPKLTTTVTSGSAAVSVDEPSRRTMVFGIEDRSLDLLLDESVAWKDLRFDVGAVQADADLHALEVGAVSVNVGASDLRLTLGTRSRDVAVEISGGAANITVRVPADAAVTVDSKSGLSNVTLPPEFKRLSGMPVLGESRWSSAGSGGPSIAISMKSGVSNLTIETY